MGQYLGNYPEEILISVTMFHRYPKSQSQCEAGTEGENAGEIHERTEKFHR